MLADAKPRETVESSAWKQWNAYEHAAEHLQAPCLDTSPRATQIRAILRIAQNYGWQSAVAQFLDAHGVGAIAHLPDDLLEALHHRMEAYVDAAMTGCSPKDILPAY